MNDLSWTIAIFNDVDCCLQRIEENTLQVLGVISRDIRNVSIVSPRLLLAIVRIG
jgi:hypothetical protein